MTSSTGSCHPSRTATGESFRKARARHSKKRLPATSESSQGALTDQAPPFFPLQDLLDGKTFGQVPFRETGNDERGIRFAHAREIQCEFLDRSGVDIGNNHVRPVGT